MFTGGETTIPSDSHSESQSTGDDEPITQPVSVDTHLAAKRPKTTSHNSDVSDVTSDVDLPEGPLPPTPTSTSSTCDTPALNNHTENPASVADNHNGYNHAAENPKHNHTGNFPPYNHSENNHTSDASPPGLHSNQTSQDDVVTSHRLVTSDQPADSGAGHQSNSILNNHTSFSNHSNHSSSAEDGNNNNNTNDSSDEATSPRPVLDDLSRNQFSFGSPTTKSNGSSSSTQATKTFEASNITQSNQSERNEDLPTWSTDFSSQDRQTKNETNTVSSLEDAARVSNQSARALESGEESTRAREEESTPAPGRYTCAVCGLVLGSLGELGIHVQEHITEKPQFQCQVKFIGCIFILRLGVIIYAKAPFHF